MNKDGNIYSEKKLKNTLILNCGEEEIGKIYEKELKIMILR